VCYPSRRGIKAIASANFSSKPIGKPLWRRCGKAVLLYLFFVYVLCSVVAELNFVPSGSMLPTLCRGDCIFVNKLAYDLQLPLVQWRPFHWADPQRGDVVVFEAPGREKRFVKRVVGLPGDCLEMRNGQLLINGEPAHDPSGIGAGPFREPAPMMSFGPVMVPAGQYFVLGDNRAASNDSRMFGAVQQQRIKGRVCAVAWSFDPNNYRLPRWERFCLKMTR
jgi:signal peptidase I